MPFNRPSLQTLLARNVASIESRLPGSDPRLAVSLLNVLANMHAGAAHVLHGHLQWNSRQMIPTSAEASLLASWASTWSVTRQAAVAASGMVLFTGTDTAVIPQGAALQRSDGAEFATDAEAVIASGTATVAVTAVVAGEESNTQPGSTLTLTTPIAGVNSTATVDGAGLTGGADIEGDDSLLSRLLARVQTPPHGGTAEDYVNWALEVPGVTRAWSYPLEGGDGKVAVRFMMDDTYTDGIPLAGDVATLQAYMDTQAPALATVTVVAPTAAPLDMTIALNPNTTTVQQAVDAELRDLFRRTTSPGGTVLYSRLNEAVSIATGEIDHTITIPADDVTHTLNQIATVGTITWQTL